MFCIRGCAHFLSFITLSLCQASLSAHTAELQYEEFCLVSRYLFGAGRAAVGEGNGTPLQYSCLENPMGGGAWQAAVHGIAKNRTRLSCSKAILDLYYEAFFFFFLKSIKIRPEFSEFKYSLVFEVSLISMILLVFSNFLYCSTFYLIRGDCTPAIFLSKGLLALSFLLGSSL